MGRIIKWGILGAGVMARHFAEDLAYCDNGVLHGIASRTADKAIDIASVHDAKAYASIDILLKDPEIDAIYIATPNSMHFEHCQLVLNAGKAVLCEKPFSVSASEAENIRRLADSKNLFCMEAMWSRFLPIMADIKSRIENGELGRIHMFRAELGFPVSYDAQSRFSDPALGGGALLDLGVYGVSLAHYFFGKPDKVHASANMINGVDEHCSALLEYNRLQAQIIASHACELPNKLVIAGETGRIEIDDLFIQGKSAQIYSYDRYAPNTINVDEGGFKQKLKQSLPGRALKKILRKLRGGGASKTLNYAYPGHGYQFQARAVGQALQSQKTLSEVMPMRDTVEVMAVLDQIRGDIKQPKKLRLAS